MRKLEAEKIDTYDEFIIKDYERMIEIIKKIKEIEQIEKKALQTIRENKEMEIVDYDLKILFLTDKEKSIIENIIFDNEEDEEYFEIMRSRRIKKSFMINN